MMSDARNEGSLQVDWSKRLTYLGKVLTFSPWLFAGVIFLNLLAALMEGVGLSFIIPIIDLIQSGNELTSDPEGHVKWFAMAYDGIGIPFSLGTVTLGIILIMSVRFTVTFLSRWLSLMLGAKYVKHLEDRLLVNALNARVASLDKTGTDRIVNAIVKQSSECRRFIKHTLLLFFLTLLSMVYIGIALFLSPFLMCVAGVLLGGLTLIFNKCLESGEKIGNRLADSNERIQKTAQSSIQGIRETKLLGLKDVLNERFREATDRKASNRVQIGRNQSLINNYYNLATIAAVFGLIYLAYFFTSLSLSSLGLFLVTLFRFSPKLSEIYSKYYDVKGYFPHVIRSYEFIEYLDQNRRESGVAPPGSIKKISVRNLDFSYEEKRVLQEVSFEARRNKISAFVGPSGAGKSTIASLIAGFHRYDKGDILVNDDISMNKIDRELWWNETAYIRQDPFIFNTTLRENLLFANEDVSEERLQQVMEDMLINEFFDDLENGLDTQLGDDGVRLSGGQSQRVALARSLLDSSQLIILDEATSALDYDLENRIYENLQAYFQEKIVLVIAHRLATIKMADEIHVMENGKIVERGTHEELLDRDGAYHKLHKEQDRNALIP